jgi:hypothetical protein
MYEVEVEGWTLGIVAGTWLYPDGDGYEPDEAGDAYVRAPDGRSATIAWTSGDGPKFERMVTSRKRGDVGAFEVRTQAAGPTTRATSQEFLVEILPALRRAFDGLK